MRVLLASLTLIGCGLFMNPARATAQVAEEVVLDGRIEMLFSEPLNPFLLRDRNLERLKPYLTASTCSGSWRGYRGTWAIDEGKLFLIALVTDPCSDTPTPVALDVLFPFTVTRVPAEWYSGTLVLPRGKMLQYVHLGYESRYERYLLITVVKGVVTGQKEVSKLK